MKRRVIFFTFQYQSAENTLFEVVHGPLSAIAGLAQQKAQLHSRQATGSSSRTSQRNRRSRAAKGAIAFTASHRLANC